MKYMIVLLLALFSTLSIAQETAPFTPDQEKQIKNLIHAALFNDPASPRIGAKHPKLTLVNFTDYNCPYCKQLDPMLEKIVQKYPDVAVIIKPLPFKGESSILAARIALTTWRDHPQQFLALHEKLMQKRGYHTDDSIKQAQQKAGATPVTLDEKSMETIRTNLQLARLVDVQGTPATIIGDQPFTCVVSHIDFQHAAFRRQLPAGNVPRRPGVRRRLRQYVAIIRQRRPQIMAAHHQHLL